jgi:G:T-mismatch repair DNA endonuclease (very short patch repair protein)
VTIIIDSDEIIKSKVENLGLNVEIKSNCEFNTYDKDIDKIKSDKQYTKRLLSWLNIKYIDENNHNVLINKLISNKDKYNSKLSEEEIKVTCMNIDELFTMEELKNIPKGKLIFLNENKGKYYCFDVIALRNFIFQKQNDKYKNPYTNTEFSQEDIDKILNVDIRKIKYFC